MGWMDNLEICLAPWKKDFISESYPWSHLWCQALMQAGALYCFTPKSLFLKAHVSAAQTLLSVLNWAAAKCVCELLHEVQWSLSKAQISFSRLTSAMATPGPYANRFFPCFFLEDRLRACLWYFLRLWASVLTPVYLVVPHVSGLLLLIYC